MYDLISVGVVTLDTFLKIHDAHVQCKVNKLSCEFVFSYADKIAVDELTQTMGGNGANNAVGSARLGLKCAIYTVYGQDQTGDMIEQTFKDEHVDLRFATRDPGAKSDSAFVLSFQAERTIFVYHEQRQYLLPKLEKSKWVYLTSLMKGFEGVHKELIEYVKKNEVKLAFNPGTHQLNAGTNALRNVFAVTQVLIVNKEEAGRLLEETESDVKLLLKGLANLGPQIVVITDGFEGSYTFDGSQFLKIGILEGPVVERTGCGDSYSTGFLAALSYGKTIADAMVWGTFNGYSVVQKIGPIAGLLTKDQMEKLASEHPHLRPRGF